MGPTSRARGIRTTILLLRLLLLPAKALLYSILHIRTRSNFRLTGSATHNGGSCQMSLSYDGGKTWVVIHSIVGGCPVDTETYTIPVPADVPSGSRVLLAWSWENNTGNRYVISNFNANEQRVLYELCPCHCHRKGFYVLHRSTYVSSQRLRRGPMHHSRRHRRRLSEPRSLSPVWRQIRWRKRSRCNRHLSL